MIKKVLKRITAVLLAAGVLSLAACDFAQSEEDNNVYYEIFVRSFADGNGDGIGDFAGASQKISYLKGLGVTGVWLMPVMPSDTYHKYDVKDYKSIDPEYGTIEDFKTFVNACHEKKIKVIIDMVVNHSSDKHPWFITACDYLRGLPEGGTIDYEACPSAGYYNFSQTKENGSYYPVEGTDFYYEAVFNDTMPDLNLKDEGLREELNGVFDFWIDLGVDGFRMDSVSHYDEEDSAASMEILGEILEYCRQKKPEFFMVGEVWESESAIAKYYGSGASFFNFDLAGPEGKIIKAARGNLSAEKLAKAMITYESDFGGENPDYIDAPFVTNHDMGRVTNALSGDESAIKFAGGLNLIMRGCPFIYYGEEIGMKSKGTKDENKRLAMNWGDSAGENCLNPENADEGITQSFPGVNNQELDQNSILNYYKNAIKIRRDNPVLAKGDTQILATFEGGNVVVLKRTCEDDFNIVVINTGDDYEIPFGEVDGPGYGIDLDKLKISGSMVTDAAQQVVYEDRTLIMPGRTIVVMK